MKIGDRDCTSIESIGNELLLGYLNKHAATNVIATFGHEISRPSAEGVWDEDHTLVLMKEKNMELVSYCWLNYEPLYQEFAVGHFYTLETFRGNGFGKLLMDYVIKKYGIKLIHGPSESFLRFAGKYAFNLLYVVLTPAKWLYFEKYASESSEQIYLFFENPEEYQKCNTEAKKLAETVVAMVNTGDMSNILRLHAAVSQNTQKFLEKYKKHWYRPQIKSDV